MAKNTGKARIPVKWIRDRAKSAYEKQGTCYICNTDVDLELHHTHSLTLLLENWIRTTGRDFSTDEAVLQNRDEFIDHHRVEIYDEVYTLCNRHHVFLHSVYGKAPGLNTTSRQKSWIETQRSKHLSGEERVVQPVLTGLYLPFICDGEFSDFY